MRWLKGLFRKKVDSQVSLSPEHQRIQQESDELRVEMMRIEAHARALISRLAQKSRS